MPTRCAHRMCAQVRGGCEHVAIRAQPLRVSLSHAQATHSSWCLAVLHAREAAPRWQGASWRWRPRFYRGRFTTRMVCQPYGQYRNQRSNSTAARHVAMVWFAASARAHANAVSGARLWRRSWRPRCRGGLIVLRLRGGSYMARASTCGIGRLV